LISNFFTGDAAALRATVFQRAEPSEIQLERALESKNHETLYGHDGLEASHDEKSESALGPFLHQRG